MHCQKPSCDAEVRVVLHDVPQDGLVADLDHRLGPHVGLLGEPRPEAARQNHRLHGRDSLTVGGLAVTTGRQRASRAGHAARKSLTIGRGG
jgi:hypothetical protein